jgi:uncharacterized membrane protein YphA (DoxX/SURF4 family)
MSSTTQPPLNRIEALNLVGRIFYGLSLAGLGVQQLQYADFRPVIVPAWPAWLHQPVLGYISGAALIIVGLLICIGRMAAKAAIILGVALVILFFGTHFITQTFLSPYSFHLGLWTDALKELALAGGAFIIADSFQPATGSSKTLAALGRFFFCLLLIVFGIDHFIYTDFVASLVPAWMPGPVFWTYLGGVALIGSGVAILLNIFRIPVSLLLALMLFLWVLMLHLPRALAATATDKGNELTSVFEALAFSGMALVIAGVQMRKRKMNGLTNV